LKLEKDKQYLQKSKLKKKKQKVNIFSKNCKPKLITKDRPKSHQNLNILIKLVNQELKNFINLTKKSILL
jgi:hypothetical protein